MLNEPVDRCYTEMKINVIWTWW